MGIDDVIAQLQRARKKPEEKKPAKEAPKPKPGEEKPLLGGDEPLDVQIPATQEEGDTPSLFTPLPPEIMSGPGAEDVTEEQPAPSEPEESEGKDMIAKITDVVATAIEQALQPVEEKIAELKAELDIVSGSMEEKFNKADSDQAALSGRIDTVQATAKDLEESVGTLGTDVNDVKGKTTGLEDSAARTAMELKNIKEGRDELDGRMDQFQATAHNLEARAGALETSVLSIDGKVTVLDGSITEAFTEAESEQAALSDKIDSAQATADGLKGQMDTFETRWNDAKKQLTEFRTNVTGAIKALPKDVEQAEKRITAKLAKRVTDVTGGIDAKVAKVQQTADGIQEQVGILEGAVAESFDKVDSDQTALSGRIDTAQAKANDIQKQVNSLEGKQSKQGDALEKATGPDFEGAEALGELREETTRKLLVEVLRATNYTDHLKEVKRKHGPQTMKALLQALASDPEFVKETLARWHCGMGLKELQEPRNAGRKEWVESTAKNIVTRAQECARGDV